MRAFLALMITLLIVLLIGITSYLLVEYQNHRNNMNNIEKSLKQERIEKQRANQRRLENQRADQRRLEKQRNYQKRLETQRDYQRKQYSKQNTQQYRSYNKQNQHQKTTYTKTKYKKRYHKYSNYIKLKSDSKISIMQDNRLTSNLPIYGSYKGYVLTKPECPKNRIHELNMYNECYVRNIHGDKFYFKKELVDNFNAFRNRKTINCHYNKKHGIMENCRI